MKPTYAKLILIIVFLTLIALSIELRALRNENVQDARRLCGSDQCILSNYSDFEQYCGQKYASWKPELMKNTAGYGVYYQGSLPNSTSQRFYFDSPDAGAPVYSCVGS